MASSINGVLLTGISQISGVTVTGTGSKNVAGTILNFSAAATTTTTTAAYLAIEVNLYGPPPGNIGYHFEDVPIACANGSKYGVIVEPAQLYKNSTLSEIYEDADLIVGFTGLIEGSYYYVSAPGTPADALILQYLADRRVELTPCQ